MNVLEEIGAGILLLELPQFGDDRGLFLKLADCRLQEIRHYEQKQLNLVVNKQAYTCRGLHYQQAPFGESKKFSVLSGAALFVAFDVQKDSPFYCEAFTCLLDRSNRALWVPRGFATGYCTLQANTTVIYSSDNDYHPEAEAGLRWDDRALPDDLLPKKDLVISAKDRSWPDFQ